MKVYSIRLKGARQPCGFVACRDFGEMAELIDELFDPSVCEFRELPAGAFFWKASAPKGGADIGDIEVNEATEEWVEALHQRRRRKYRPLVDALDD